MSLPAPFNSTREFRAAFVRGLSDMLVEDDLGTLILVMANATIDKNIKHILHERLATRFLEFEAEFKNQLQPEKVYPADDLDVFRKLLEVGFENLQITQCCKSGCWELQYNQMRGFRPSRAASQKIEGLIQPFNPDGFHFNKPFLHKEILWEGELLGRSCRLLYNKFPFAELHGLLVLDAEQEYPQFMRAADHEFIWALVQRLGQQMQGVGFAYNAYGAYASINHQHFQMYVRDGGRYPIEHAHWQHRGGKEAYPLGCFHFVDPLEAWAMIESMHDLGQSYNLLYRPGGLYILPRRTQGSYEHSDWTQGFAWAEAAGSITAFSQEDFERLTAADIHEELARLVLPVTP